MSSTATLLKVKKPVPIVKKYPKAVVKSGNVSVQAGDSLLRGIKAKMMRKKGKIDFSELRRRGYSEALIQRLKKV
jgi:hypothetical protein